MDVKRSGGHQPTMVQGRDAGENLIAATSACSLHYKNAPLGAKGMLANVRYYLAIKINMSA